MAAKWTLAECWAAIVTATAELDVAAVSRDQYRAWQLSRPDRERFPPLNSMDRVALDYGLTFFHVESGRGHSPKTEWAKATCVDSVDRSNADTIVGYKSWRSMQRHPDDYPAWSVIDRKLDGWSGVKAEIAKRKR